LLFPQGDAPALARSIVRLVQDRGLREEMGARALESVKERYSWLTLSKQISSILDEIRESPRR